MAQYEKKKGITIITNSFTFQIQHGSSHLMKKKVEQFPFRNYLSTKILEKKKKWNSS